MSVRLCPTCKGARLKPEALAVRLHGKTITEVSALSIGAAHEFFSTLDLSAAGGGDRRAAAAGDRASGSDSCTTSGSTT